MRVFKDKPTGKYKSGTNSSNLYDTKEQCQRAVMNELAEKLSIIRKKLESGCLSYGK
jgi:hypothetical protein